jgi:uncharacterized protein (DUF486 family)
MHLADGHQHHVGLRAIGAAAGIGDLLADAGKIGGYIYIVGEGHAIGILLFFIHSVEEADVGDRVWPVVLLVGSNIFMTFAWYGHLKFKEVALWKVILVSWSIALFEYCLQVPANRLGSRVYSPDQLKVIQEVVTLSVFGVFSVYYFGDKLHWNHAVAFGCLVAGAFFMFHKF